MCTHIHDIYTYMMNVCISLDTVRQCKKKYLRKNKILHLIFYLPSKVYTIYRRYSVYCDITAAIPGSHSPLSVLLASNQHNLLHISCFRLNRRNVKVILVASHSNRNISKISLNSLFLRCVWSKNHVTDKSACWAHTQ